MVEPNNTSNSEVDVSDSWTIVNSDDSEASASAETRETSDSESLEVLEVEQEESEHYCQDDLEIEGEENGSEECSKDCHDSFLLEEPLIDLAAIQKVRKYVHHPSAYINMWLSVVMVIAIAVTLGLGIGHYLGSKRFARAKDMIHHLKYENRILEQELADVTMKNKHCESDLLSRVRQPVVELNQSEISESYCRSSHFQDMYANLIYGRDEDVCYADENPLFANFLQHSFVNDTLPPFLHWISYINDGKQVLDYPFENEFTINRSYIISEDSENASSDIELLPKLEVINVQMHSNTSHFQLSKLNTQLTYLHSLLKKWNEFRGNLKLPASDSKTESFAGLQNTEHLSEVACKVMPAVSGSPYKVPNENIKSRLANSSNGFCRSKINQCVLHEEKRQKKEKKCYALTKAQLLCSLLQRSKKKQGNNFLLGKQKAHTKKDKKQVPEFSIEQKKYRKVEKTEFNSEKKIGKGENGEIDTKKHNYSESDSKRIKKKGKVENSVKKMVRKEKNNKFKYISKNHKNVDKKEKRLHQSKKQFTHLQNQKKQLSKPNTKNKQFKNYYFKENIKNENKRHVTRDKNKRKYTEKFPSSESMNRKNDEKCISCSNDQRQCRFHKNFKKLTENGKYFAYSRCGSSRKAYQDSEKYSCSKNAKRNTVKNFKKCSSDKGHCKFHSSDKKMSEDKKHYKFVSSGKSFKFKTSSNEKKNDSENASCKYSFLTHPKDENFPKYLKERGKIYDLHVQEMNIFKT